ncbi:MAG TPA: VWA domain-containing protein [Candidatus Aquilonibacter sp.]|nr:VWA domain-containing protein [Candidatus Aquilonibacter sp.]
MGSFARCLLLLSVTGLSLRFCCAQAAPASPQAGSSPQNPPGPVATLHTGTKLVVVDVVVRDRNGHPIHGLTRSDFVLSESGRPQTINSFDEYAAPATPPAPPQMPVLPPGQFTDFTPIVTKGPLNVLLIDGLNTPLADQSYLQQQLVDYVQHIPAGTRIAIFGLSNHLYMLQGFTSDPRQLLAVLRSGKGVRSSPLQNNSSTNGDALLDSATDPFKGAASESNSSAMMSNDVATFIESIGVMQTSLRIGQTIEAFNSLGRWLLNFPGRKNVIWFSGSFPLGVDPAASIQNNTDIPGEGDDVFRAMINLLTRAQVSVYPVDPRGLQTNPAFTPGANMNPNQGTAYQQGATNFYAMQAAEHGTMQAFASDTGGIPFYNRNNLTQAVADAIEDGSNYYTLSYSPSEKKTGGEWRSIHVELANPANYKGVQISYRRGYFADDLKVPGYHTGTASVSEDPNAPSAEALRSSKAAMLHGAPLLQDIPFTTRVLPASAALETTPAPGNELNPKDPMKPPYRRYDIDCAAVSRYFNLTEQPNGHRVGAIQTAIIVYDEHGKMLNAVSRTLHLDFTPEEYAQFQHLGYREHMEVSAPAMGESFFRIGVEERTTGRIGTVEVASSAVRNLPPMEYAPTQPQERKSP